MKAYLPYLLPAAAVFLGLVGTQNLLEDKWKPQPAPAVKTLTLPPEIEKAQAATARSTEPIRMEAFLRPARKTAGRAPGGEDKPAREHRQLSAIMILGEKRYAMIAGRTYTPGDRLDNQRIVRIDRDAVWLEDADGKRERMGFLR